ncbi:MAG TPA: zinc-binding dehydrogenase [Anaeromyxobacter sp.]
MARRSSRRRGAPRRRTVFTTSPGKLADAQRLGARHAVLSTDAAAMKALAGTFDLLIATVPKAFDMSPFMNALKLDGTLVNVGALEVLKGLDGMGMAYGRKSVAGSLIGGIAQTQEVIDYCAARGIKADVEVEGFAGRKFAKQAQGPGRAIAAPPRRLPGRCLALAWARRVTTGSRSPAHIAA